MINENEVREAVEWGRTTKDISVHDLELDILLSLAEYYLKASKEMPEKKEIGEMRYGGCNPDFDNGYNQAIDDCTLAMLKREQRMKKELEKKLDGLEAIIKSKHIMTGGISDTDVFVVVPTKELATAIRNHLKVE